MIVVRIWEGLGNQMFQYAYARALQLRTGQRVYIDADRMYKNLLEGHSVSRKFTLDRFHVRLPIAVGIDKKYSFLEQNNILQIFLNKLSSIGILAPKFFREKYPEYDEKLKYASGNIYMMGWFQDERYFEEYRDVLLKEFTPRNKIHISVYLKKILNEKETVSIHIRRCDYRKTKDDLPATYYASAMKYMEYKLDNPYYIVFTDDIGWVKKNIIFKNEVIYVSDEEKLQDYEELLVMSKCKHNIIANSTFSWWGAWLNRNEDKIVVGPKKWYGNMKNIMPNKWIRVGWKSYESNSNVSATIS